MKTARLVLTALALATLAACGTGSITGPSPENAHKAVAPADTGVPTTTNSTCSDTVEPDGTITRTCTEDGRGPYGGSGG